MWPPGEIAGRDDARGGGERGVAGEPARADLEARSLEPGDRRHDADADKQGVDLDGSCRR